MSTRYRLTRRGEIVKNALGFLLVYGSTVAFSCLCILTLAAYLTNGN